jgi:predicted transcriptional regulator
MYAPPDHWPGEPRYQARLEVHLDQATQRKIKALVTAFRRHRSSVLRHVLQWGLDHGQGWTLDRHRPRGWAHRVSLRIEPELRQQVEEAADFPASWQATSAERKRAPQRSHDSRQYGTRFMLRLDDASLAKLDAFTQVFVTSRAEVIRQLIIQATPKVFPKSWHLAAQERRQRQAREADTRLGHR